MFWLFIYLFIFASLRPGETGRKMGLRQASHPPPARSKTLVNSVLFFQGQHSGPISERLLSLLPCQSHEGFFFLGPSL